MVSRRTVLSAALAVAFGSLTDASARGILRGSRLASVAAMTLTVTAGTYEGDSTTAVSGVAPLFVHMDCSASTSLLTTKPFREVLYVHDCGDPGSGNYAYGAFGGTSSASRNTGYGAEHGHVYRTPGTYSWVVSAYDRFGVPVTKTVTVTVRDGSLVEWAGGRTVLASTTGNFTCAGLTNAANVGTYNGSDSEAALTQAMAVGETLSVAGNTQGRGPIRLAYRTGENFTCATSSASTTAAWLICARTGPVMICSYDDNGIITDGSGGATITATSANSDVGIFELSKESALMQPGKGITITSLTLDGTAHTVGHSYAIQCKGNVRWALVQFVTFTNIGQVCFNQSSRNRNSQKPSNNYLPYDGIAMVDCTHTGRNNNGDANGLFYGMATRVYIAGCDTYGKGDVDGTYGSHNLRILWGAKIKIEHNTLRHPKATRHCLKIHSEQILPWGEAAQNPNIAWTALAGTYYRPWDPVPNGYSALGADPPVFLCTVGGLTAASQPTWDTTIGNNTVSGAATFQCVNSATITPDDLSWRTPERYATTDVVIDANRFTGWVTPNVVSLGPQDREDFTEVYRVVVSRNWWDCGNASSVTYACAEVMCREVTFVNNAFDLSNTTGNGSPANFIHVTYRDYPATVSVYGPSDIRAYNNDFYASVTSAAGLSGVFGNVGSLDVVAKNNVLYYGSTVGAKTIVAISGTTTGATNTGDVSTVATDPGYAGALSAIANWVKGSGSYGKNTGSSVPVFNDLYGTLRSGTYDIGVHSQ